MATEIGVVTRVEKETAWVKTHRKGGCETCAYKGVCRSLGDGKEIEVQVINNIGARIGDRVRILLDSGKLFNIWFLIYIVPILMLLMGALLGEEISKYIGINHSAGAVVVGFAFFCLGFVILRLRSNAIAGKAAYQPRISKII